VTSKTPTIDTLSPSPSRRIAAIDMGSNSFHIIVAQEMLGEIRILDKMGEKVQLAAGLNENLEIDEEAQQRAFACLNRFAQRINGVETVQVVGTNTLRIAKNSQSFIEKVEQILDHSVEIIAGREEARLIYLGVSHTLADDAGKRLVIDIGGGSTEFIIGERFEPQILDSLHMGCVSYQQRFFKDDTITEANIRRAETQASRELLNISKRFRRIGWENCVGSSGSVKAISIAIETLGLGDEGITPHTLSHLRSHVIQLGKASAFQELGIKKDRCAIFVSGLAILKASFDVLGISMMTFADGALREGLLYDLAGRNQHEDVCSRTITALQKRYHVNIDHANAVENTTLNAFYQLRSQWGLDAPIYNEYLKWACRTHEIGLALSHTQFHKHGAYILNVSDLAGFSKRSQLALSTLVRAHRRKLTSDIFSGLPPKQQKTMIRLALLLRIGVLLQHSHNGEPFTDFNIEAKDQTISLQFPDNWLNEHVLTLADLESEQEYVAKIGITLKFE